MARRRTRSEYEGDNPDRWMVSYADFITLLFALFVVLYAISSVNEGKYEVLSDSLLKIFQATPSDQLPIQLEKQPRIEAPVVTGGTAAEGAADGGALQEIRQRLYGELQALVDDKQVTVSGNELWLEVNLPAAILFSTGSATLAERALGLLEDLGTIFKDYKNVIRVEGHTDDWPINTARFPSNWELSAARAAAVARLFVQNGVAPDRLSAVGYAQYQPLASNRTEQGRQRNRRVVLWISKDGPVRSQDQ